MTLSPRVAVIDLGINNLASICRRLEDAGADKLVVLREPIALTDFTHVVLPGVGAFDAAMNTMHSLGWPEVLHDATQTSSVPLLGICLGMQLLGDSSEEGEPVPGLGLVAGRTVRLTPRAGERVPHVGWNEVVPAADADLFRGVDAGTDFYFVHSYTLKLEDSAEAAAITPYAEGVVSAIQRGTVLGVQFHPEKSSTAGLRVLKNFLALKDTDAQGARHSNPAVGRLRVGQG